MRPEIDAEDQKHSATGLFGGKGGGVRGLHHAELYIPWMRTG